MYEVYWPLLAFVPFFVFLIAFGFRKRPCPECGGPLFGFQSPWTKTRRQWRDGGFLCPRCGCESDLSGKRVDSGTNSR